MVRAAPPLPTPRRPTAFQTIWRQGLPSTHVNSHVTSTRRAFMTKPVLIVGAGPVGMTLATELTRYGVPVRIVDKAAQRTDKSKALVLWSRTLELFDRNGSGSVPFIEAGFKVDAVDFFAGDDAIGRITMSSVKSPHPYAL